MCSKIRGEALKFECSLVLLERVLISKHPWTEGWNTVNILLIFFVRLMILVLPIIKTMSDSVSLF